MTDAEASWADRIVAEFGDGHPVEAIAGRYGLTVEQVYAVVHGEVGPAGYYAPPPVPGQGYYAPPPVPGQGYYAPPPPPGYSAQVHPPAQPVPPASGPPAPPAGPGYYPPPSYGAPAPTYGAPGQPPAYGAPGQPPAYGAPGQPPPFPHEDAIIAEYADGHDVNAIAYRYGLTPDQVLWLIQRALQDDPQPPQPPQPPAPFA